jgi:hypothetical protein
MKRVSLRREAALATFPGMEKFAIQAARRVVRLQERRRKMRRELKAIDDELRIAKGQLRAVMKPRTDDSDIETPMPTIAAVNE